MTKKNNIINFPVSYRATLEKIMSEAEPVKSLGPTSFEQQLLSSILRLEALLKKTA